MAIIYFGLHLYYNSKCTLYLSNCNHLSKITNLKLYQLNEIVAGKKATKKTDYQKVLTCNKKIQSHLGNVYCVNLCV